MSGTNESAFDDMKHVTNKGLEVAILSHEQYIEDLRGQISIHQARIDRYKAILDRRALDAYWVAHPELIRLEVGDKLAITDDVNKEIHSKERNWGKGAIELFLTTDLTVDQLRDDQWVLVKFGEVSGTLFTLSMVSDMRKAYLEREASK